VETRPFSPPLLGPGNEAKFNQTAKTYHVNECLAILADSGSETTSEALKIKNFPGGGMPPDPPTVVGACFARTYIILYRYFHICYQWPLHFLFTSYTTVKVSAFGGKLNL